MLEKVIADVETFEFVDDRRLNFYFDHLLPDGSQFPIWAPDDAPAEPNASAEVIRKKLAVVLAHLNEHGYVASQAMMSSDPWLSGGYSTQKSTFRLHTMEARRVKLPPGDDDQAALWISTNPGWKVFLWENSNQRDSLHDRSTEHTTLDRFTLIFFNELQSTGLDWTKLFLKDFRGDPVDALWQLGGEASPLLDVTMVYKLGHVCYPVTDEEGLVASFGYPLAVWKTPDSAMDATPATAEPIEDILILFSVDDPATERHAKRIKSNRLLKGLNFSFCYATHRFGQAQKPDSESLYSKLSEMIKQGSPQGLIVHLGSAFHTAPEVYRDVLKRIRQENPDLLFATDAATEAGNVTLQGIDFDQTDELHNIVKAIFG